MSRQIVIDPVTRIEGHAKVSIYLDDSGEVNSARFHVTEFRGFEKFCEGRTLWEMAGITARICGICPVSHLLASAKTGDKALAVSIPPAAEKLRRLMNLGQFTQSHALSFFHLSSPDMILGFDSDPATRNVFGLIAADPELARKGIRLRQWGQEIIELLGAKKVHPAWAVPGGVRQSLTEETREQIRSRIPESLATAREALGICKRMRERYPAEAESFGDFPSLYMGLVGANGEWEHYGGSLRVVDHLGYRVADGLSEDNYKDFVGEASENWSYLKFPYFKPRGYPGGIYRVGPLARLNVCDRIGTPLADRELQEYREMLSGAVANNSFLYHHARLIEIIAAIEGIERLLEDDDVCSHHLRAEAGINRLDVVGVSEAPRGTLFHHYQLDEDGKVLSANLIIATGQNNLAINRTVEQIAKRFVKGPDIAEGMLNRVEAGIRAYDPCLSCSTHAAGRMPLTVELVASDGEVLRTITRD
jgi:NAD-reducing hydrogenase large subunit